jgi:hypothetical protein
MPLERARTGSERGVRATLKRATGPYSTSSSVNWTESYFIALLIIISWRYFGRICNMLRIPWARRGFNLIGVYEQSVSAVAEQQSGEYS